MNQPKSALSSKAQAIQVFLYMNELGSINRYEADADLAVCGLAPRIFELKEDGLKIIDIKETVMDTNGVLHRGIKRYFIDWQSMSPQAIQHFSRIIESLRNNG